MRLRAEALSVDSLVLEVAGVSLRGGVGEELHVVEGGFVGLVRLEGGVENARSQVLRSRPSFSCIASFLHSFSFLPYYHSWLIHIQNIRILAGEHRHQNRSPYF